MNGMSSVQPAPLLPAAGSAEQWRVVESRIVIVDGVSVHYDLSRCTAKDANGTLQQYAAVRMRWPTGTKVIPTTGFVAGMSDAQLIQQVRHALSGLQKK
ncbi:MAG: hypothetical protein ABJB66_12835 [Gemmatimonadaceae bacterium]